MFSNQNASKSLSTSNKVIIKIAEVVKQRQLTPEEKTIVTKKYMVLIRKSAHFFLYFTLSILLFALLKEFTDNKLKLIIITILLCTFYAITDELHQGFVSGRTSKMFDIFIDTLGATIGTSLSYLFLKLRKKHIKNK